MYVDIPFLVTTVVSGTLGLNEVSPEANFFALGGTSIAALDVTSQLHELLGFDIPLEMLFECESLGQFSEAIRDLAPHGFAPTDTASGATADQ